MAIELHAIALLLIERGYGAEEQAVTPTVAAQAPAGPLEVGPAPARVTTVALIREVPDGLRLVPIRGAGDQDGAGDQHPFPDASADFPGVHAAARGGGDTGGAERFSRERYARDARAELWNDDQRYRSPRRASSRVGGGQPLRRTREPGFDPRARPPRAAHDTGTATGRGTAPEPPALGVDQAFPAESGASSTLVRSGPAGPLTAGDHADPVDAARGSRGPTRVATPGARLLARTGPETASGPRRDGGGDRVEVAAASDALDPLPIELVSPRSGRRADGHGVAGSGPPGGVIANGSNRRGTAATSAHIAAGRRAIAIEASRQNPYFRRMYQRVDRVVVFPRRLAIAMEQGEVIARFTLYADGRIGDLVIAKSSGFEDFDDELLRALEIVAPFGAVPAAVLAGRDRVTVVTPYAFRNPLIR